jgi:hypothetical protein
MAAENISISRPSSFRPLIAALALASSWQRSRTITEALQVFPTYQRSCFERGNVSGRTFFPSSAKAAHRRASRNHLRMTVVQDEDENTFIDQILQPRYSEATDVLIENELCLRKGVSDRDEHVDLLLRNFRKHANQDISDFIGEGINLVTDTRFALFSHGKLESDNIDGPINNYANFGALGKFQCTYSQFVQLPCTRMALPGQHQKALTDTLDELRPTDSSSGNPEDKHILQNYSGWGCAITSREPFFIKDAFLWNVFDDDGNFYGQATLFDREKVDSQ